jgi:hypothetical protein
LGDIITEIINVQETGTIKAIFVMDYQMIIAVQLHQNGWGNNMFLFFSILSPGSQYV